MDLDCLVVGLFCEGEIPSIKGSHTRSGAAAIRTLRFHAAGKNRRDQYDHPKKSKSPHALTSDLESRLTGRPKRPVLFPASLANPSRKTHAEFCNRCAGDA